MLHTKIVQKLLETRESVLLNGVIHHFFVCVKCCDKIFNREARVSERVILSEIICQLYLQSVMWIDFLFIRRSGDVV